MNRNNFTKGLIAGTIIGATVSMVVNPAEGKDRKVFRKKTGKILRTVGHVIEDMVDMAR